MSDAEKVRFDAIRDEDIDYSDIPELDDAWFARATRPGREGPREAVTMRLPPRVVAFYKGQSPQGYTSRMADVLEAYAKAHARDDG
ncbi:BrnA antitoxin family protein [Jannaschia sp. LMIT008]|uniref:BrnA antitoxin family protein n=1 Tax=Jannaschia maritima TaxID=3032585 RepID=UPI0028125016|nr:BrnA antitoxin family protein [Jannaschia sp. LMIT008]